MLLLFLFTLDSRGLLCIILFLVIDAGVYVFFLSVLVLLTAFTSSATHLVFCVVVFAPMSLVQKWPMKLNQFNGTTNETTICAVCFHMY